MTQNDWDNINISFLFWCRWSYSKLRQKKHKCYHANGFVNQSLKMTFQIKLELSYNIKYVTSAIEFEMFIISIVDSQMN